MQRVNPVGKLNLGLLSRCPSEPALTGAESTTDTPLQTNMSKSCSSSALPTASSFQTTRDAYADWMDYDQASWQELHRYAQNAGIEVGIAAAKASRPKVKARKKYMFYHKVPDMRRIGYASSHKKKEATQSAFESTTKVDLLGKKKTIAQRSHELKLMVVIDPAIKQIRYNLKNAAFYCGERVWDRLFEQYDGDGSGRMDFSQFKSLVRRDGRVSERSVSDDMLEIIFKSVDVESSGSIEISELVEWLEGTETTIWEDYHLNTYKPGLQPERKKQVSSYISSQSKRCPGGMVIDWKDDLIQQMGRQIDELKSQLQEPGDQTLVGADKTEAQTAAHLRDSSPGLYFCASVSRFEGESLGLKLATNLRVEAVLWDGLVAAWNAENPNKCVQSGDRIIEVNGRRDAASIVDECQKLQHLDIFVERLPNSEITKDDDDYVATYRQSIKVIMLNVDVNRSMGEDLGLQLKWPAILVEKISWQGLIGAWNMKHADQAVQVGDQIIEVNGLRGGGNIVPELKRLKRLHIVFSRGGVIRDSSPDNSRIITLETKKEDAIVGKIRRNLKAAAYTSKGLDWTKLFRWADHNKSGLLGYDEFHHLIRIEAKLSAKVLPEEQLTVLFRQVDTEDVGEVTYLEFLQWLGFDRADDDTLEVPEHVHPREAAHRRLSTTIAEQVMRDIRVTLFKIGSDRWPSMFEHYDRSKSGQINLNDFHMLMRKDFKIPDKVANEKVLREIFSCLDFNTFGTIAYSEFVAWLTGQPVLEP